MHCLSNLSAAVTLAGHVLPFVACEWQGCGWLLSAAYDQAAALGFQVLEVEGLEP